MLRQYAIVQVTKSYRDLLIHHNHEDSILASGRSFIFLGEIPNQQGHAVLIDCITNENVIGVHMGNLYELSDDET
jgi:hypothetical protein